MLEQYKKSIKLPKQDEWTLLYRQQDLQNQKYSIIQKQKEKIRKQAFKEALDKHIELQKQKINQDKLQDYRYYQSIVDKQKKAKQLQQKQKIQKINKRRSIEQTNKLIAMQYLQPLSARRQRSMATTELQNNEKSDNLKKNELQKRIVQQLQQQLRQKNQLKKISQLNQILQEQKNANYLQRQSQRIKSLQKKNKFQQNMQVYENLDRISKEKKNQQQQYDRRLIEEAARNRRLQQEQKIRRQEQLKKQKNNEIKDSLLQQIQIHNSKKSQRKQTEDIAKSNHFQNIFYQKQRNKSFDKKQYLNYLLKQNQEQKRKQSAQKYMNQAQYRYNFNQLNRLVSGQYKNDQYRNRSPLNIGNPEQISQRRDEFYLNKMNGSSRKGSANSDLDERIQKVQFTNDSKNLNKEDLMLVKNKLQHLQSHNILAHYQSQKK